MTHTDDSDNYIHNIIKTQIRTALGSGTNRASSGIQKKVVKNITAPIDYIEGLEDLPIRVAQIPLGPTHDDIRGMIRTGFISPDNIIDEETAQSRVNIEISATSTSTNTQNVGSNKINRLVRKIMRGVKKILSFKQKPLERAISNFELKLEGTNSHEYSSIPQIVSYQIKDINQLYKIMRGKSWIKDIKTIFANKDKPTIYLMNQAACQLYAQYLGGRLPSEMELIEIWQRLPGKTSIDKATSNNGGFNSGIPLLGHYTLSDGFQSIGDSTYLHSSGAIFSCLSSPKNPKKIKSLVIDSRNKILTETPVDLFGSTMVVFDKSE